MRSSETRLPVSFQQISGNAQPLVQLLSNRRYGLDYYQREYSWEDSQVTELIDDLTSRFLDQYDSSHERPQVASYRAYFLGPIVTTPRDGVSYLVDGQQRITTLSLLLMYLRRCLIADKRDEDVHAITALVCSSAYGKKTFNLDVDERNACLEAIFEDKAFDAQSEPRSSVRNLWERYQTIDAQFPEDLRGDRLPYFVDWILHRVILVEIGTPDQDMALEIFETMNDRGLRLNSIDMLKSHLLTQVDANRIEELNDRWRRHVTELNDAERNADAEFVKAWLRGKYAQTQRERKANASPGDFDIIGTSFHKWVRDHAAAIGLRTAADYQHFVEDGFLRLGGRYLHLLRACQKFDAELESVYYVTRTGFTLLLPVILAAVTPDDDHETFVGKATLVARALDIYIVRRMVNYRRSVYSTVVYTMFTLIKKIRDLTTDELRRVLVGWLQSESERLDGICSGHYGPFGLTQRNRKDIRYILARITSWLDRRLATGVTFSEYVDRSRPHPYEVEHIWADHFDRHRAEFQTETDFQAHRNRLGALLLLPKDFNASYGDMPYADKVEHYRSRNPLAQSLHPQAYEHNPTFTRLMHDYGVEFKPYPNEFSRSAIDERQRLYQRLAEIVWDPEQLAAPDHSA